MTIARTLALLAALCTALGPAAPLVAEEPLTLADTLRRARRTPARSSPPRPAGRPPRPAPRRPGASVSRR